MTTLPIRVPETIASDGSFSLDGILFKVIVGGDYHRLETDEDGVVLLKDWAFVEKQLAELDGLEVSQVLEFGVWQGGSSILWALISPLKKYVGIDINPNEIPFPNTVRDHKRYGTIGIFGGVSQDDRQSIDRIVAQEFSGPLDLVIDDASHQYHLSKATFNIAFPKLRPGGVYILEDWAWAHWRGDYQQEDHVWAEKPAPTNLVFELIMAAASRPDIISHIKVFNGFVLLWRGQADLDADFDLDRVIICRGKPLTLI